MIIIDAPYEYTCTKIVPVCLRGYFNLFIGSYFWVLFLVKGRVESLYKKLKKYKKHGKRIMMDKRFYIIPLMCLLAGLCAGAVQAKGIGQERLSVIESAYAQSIESQQDTSGVFVHNVLRNGGLMLIIWLSAFLPFGHIAACFILFVSAMSYGLTSVALFPVLSRGGFMYIASLGIQWIILLAAAFFLCVSGLYYRASKNKQESQNRHLLLTYFVILLIAETAVILASMLTRY